MNYDRYVPPKILEEIRKIDLLTYLKNYEPNELVQIDERNYSTRSHDSVIISKGLWHRFSTDVGGKSALDYLIKVYNWDFKKAANYLWEKINIQKPVIEVPKKYDYPKKISIPKRDKTNDKVIEYLEKRGIDESIINFCIIHNLIYQEEKTENVVFLGYDNDNNIRYAMMRSTGKNRIVREASGSDKRYSFNLLSTIKSEKVHLFESSIDLLSYATLLKMSGYRWNENNLISLRTEFMK